MTGQPTTGEPTTGQPEADFAGDRLTGRRVPVSTYRIQFHGGFGFRDAARIVPYLSRLGIDACYCSPYLMAKPGTSHGYDVCDPSRLHPELGDDVDYRAFTDALAEAGMAQIIDFVPNHMGVDPVANRWWRDVLENGPASRYAHYFDIDWDPVKPELRGKVLLPLLDDQYGMVLERGELRLDWDAGRLVVRKGEMHFPIDPKQYPRVLGYRPDRLERRLGNDHAGVRELRDVTRRLGELPGCGEVDRRERRQRDGEMLLARLARLIDHDPEVAGHLRDNLDAFRGEPGKPESFDRLHELLEAQPYRLAYWKVAHDEINYRRFFHIHELGAVRMEDPEVFQATHGLILRLVRDGTVHGIRLDHLDGLHDPLGYLERLQEAVLIEQAAARSGADPRDEAWRARVRAWRAEEQHRDPGGGADRPLYLIAEKILSPGESLPRAWPLDGTSGYEFLNDVNRLFVDADHRADMHETYARFVIDQIPFEEEVYRCKRLITQVAMASELKMLARALNRISEGDRRTRDYTLDGLRETIREVVACFPVYRTYLDDRARPQATDRDAAAPDAADGEPPDGDEIRDDRSGDAGAARSADGDDGPSERPDIRPADREIILRAIGRAVWRNPAMSPDVFGFLRQVLLLEDVPSERAAAERLAFTQKFQQYTGPVEAKGVEDTAFYRHHVLLSLNEVGGNPDRFGSSPDEFHQANRRRRRQWPTAMLATATHDNKRGEDVRLRINVLSELPDAWRRNVSLWQRLHAVHRRDVDGSPAPDAADEYALYQTLVGAWPAEWTLPDQAEPTPSPVPDAFVGRIRDYMLKAAKEANRRTGWADPIEAYDRALGSFVESVLQGSTTNEFLNTFLPFQRRVARCGMTHSLSQVVLKWVSPGVPDFYQGDELWDENLVDPDNRRPVAYDLRRRYLESLRPILDDQHASERLASVRRLLDRWQDGRIKMLVTACGLRLRRDDPELFLRGEYLPLSVGGSAARHAIAAARTLDGRGCIAIAPRLVAAITTPERPIPLGDEAWGTTRVELPEACRAGRLRNLVTGEAFDPSSGDNPGTLRLGQVLRHLPVALLGFDVA